MEKIEQIDIYGKKVIDYDDRVTKIYDYVKFFKDMGFSVEVEMFGKNKKIIKANTPEKKYIFLLANITYLGNPHPIYKKRVQLKKWWKDVWSKYSNDYKILFLGVYKYQENIVFVDFNVNDYIDRKMNNSSAHIYINDIYQAMKKKYYFKRDKNNNTINIIRKVYFKEYLNTKEEKIGKSDDELINIIDNINSKIPFNTDLKGDDCYKEMIKNNYSKMLEPEWAGFYIEYLYEKILKQEVSIEILAVNKSSKQSGELDFDLYSKKYNFYSDLKSSDKSKTETPLNDKINVIKALETHGKLCYIIYEHTTTKDSEINYQVCKYWNTKINEIKGKEKDLMSYHTRMKGIVNFKNMIILEVNNINASEILKEFNQGKNSNGKERKGKFKIKKKDIENYIIYRFGE